MDINKISVGENAPWDINVINEIPQGGSPIKYEFDKDSGAIFVDRFMQSAMFYPANYGFVPHTLAKDGDPADVLIVCNMPIVPGAVVRCRPVGVLIMEDESGMDEKIIAVPVDKLNSFFENVKEHTDLPSHIIASIEHFFTHYKDLEKGKWTKVVRWGNAEEAASLIQEAIDTASA